MTRVSVFGLTVESEIPLPAPAARDTAVDVSIRYGRVPPTLDGARLEGRGFASHERATLLRLRDVGRFLVRDGREIIVDPAPGAQPAWILHPLWPDAAECLGVSGTHPHLMPATTKRLVTGVYPAARDSAPIAQVLVLGTGIGATNPRLQGRQRVLDLTDHRFLPNTVHGQTGRQAAQMLALANKVPVGRLARAPGSIEASLATMSRDVLRCLDTRRLVESPHVTIPRLPSPHGS